ncbi:uncharacterized protein LOC141588601 [Silene latifolia]|uniref:uncharacterized protein LOC141588601 n=1 Tax=Silene latifolia TaxID=37657 RepID=UPI003D773CB5
MSLKSRRKFGFVDGSIKKPTDKFDLDNWEVVHCTLVQWIRNTIDPSLLDIISYVEDASVLWSELEAQFSVVDGSRIHDLKTQLHDCRQLKASAIKRLDNERLHQFFMGLDASLYANVRSQQFQLDLLPSLSRAYQVVLQEERLRVPSTTSLNVSDVADFATPGMGRGAADRSLKMKIGAGELRDGLYWICAGARTTTMHSLSDEGSLEVWHRRLGHPSSKVFKTLPFASTFNFNKESYTRGDKFEKRGRKCIFVVFPHNKKGWKLYDLETKTFFVSRDVVFHETSFPYTSPNSSPLVDPVSTIDEPFNGSLDMTGSATGEGPTATHGSGAEGRTVEEPITGDTGATGGFVTGDMGTASEVVELGCGRRQKFSNSQLRGYVLGIAQTPSSRSPSPPPSSSGTPYSLANYIDCNSFSEKHRHFLAAITSNVGPPTFKEAIRDEKWCAAMKEEIEALERNEPWELTDLPTDKKPLVEGLDYGETFSPVVKMVTIRAFLSVAAING